MLEGKNAILTGANGGIGSAILRALAKNRVNLWCPAIGITDEFREETERLADENGIFIRLIDTDLSDRAAIRTAFSEIVKDRKPVDILVNNAGINYRGSFLMTSLEDMDRVLQINYYAPVQMMQLAAKRMIRSGGGIMINICSASGYEHNTGTFAYGASKNALIWATQTASRELAPYNIRVNGIAPGVTETSINRGYESVMESEVIPRMNIRRMGKPEEIAEAVLYLAGDQSSFVSGQILRVDGGRF